MKLQAGCIVEEVKFNSDPSRVGRHNTGLAGMILTKMVANEGISGGHCIDPGVCKASTWKSSVADESQISLAHFSRKGSLPHPVFKTLTAAALSQCTLMRECVERVCQTLMAITVYAASAAALWLDFLA